MVVEGADAARQGERHHQGRAAAAQQDVTAHGHAAAAHQVAADFAALADSILRQLHAAQESVIARLLAVRRTVRCALLHGVVVLVLHPHAAEDIGHLLVHPLRVGGGSGGGSGGRCDHGGRHGHGAREGVHLCPLLYHNLLGAGLRGGGVGGVRRLPGLCTPQVRVAGHGHGVHRGVRRRRKRVGRRGGGVCVCRAGRAAGVRGVRAAAGVGVRGRGARAAAAARLRGTGVGVHLHRAGRAARVAGVHVRAGGGAAGGRRRIRAGGCAAGAVGVGVGRAEAAGGLRGGGRCGDHLGTRLLDRRSGVCGVLHGRGCA
mmetsp:Transcript_11211/g.28285  ORF Transcript_11211/g.28285 Transcript_11211/m.28285 type:complete len:316 (+) Transcript_11211:50-997(+)